MIWLKKLMLLADPSKPLIRQLLADDRSNKSLLDVDMSASRKKNWHIHALAVSCRVQRFQLCSNRHERLEVVQLDFRLSLSSVR